MKALQRSRVCCTYQDPLRWALLAAALAAAPCIAQAADSAASDPPPSPAFLLQVPPEARTIAPTLRMVVQVAQTSLETEEAVRRLRIEHDDFASKLAAAASEVQLLDEQHERQAQELSALDSQARERVTALHKNLEAKLERQLAEARQTITQEQQEEFARQVQQFQAHQSEAITAALTKGLVAKEREVEQATQELSVLTDNLGSQFSRLGLDAQMALSIQQSLKEAVVKKKKESEVELQRTRLESERDAQLARVRQDFAAKLQEQFATESARRLTLKEASLRSGMADLLHKTGEQEDAQVTLARERLADLDHRRMTATQHHALLKTRAEDTARGLEAALQRVKDLHGQRDASLTRLEQALQNPHASDNEQALAWLGQALPSLPPAIAADLEALQQRMAALIRQERQLAEQRRVLRERQLALQLSRALELQYQRNRLRQQQEAQALAKRIEEGIARANELGSRGQFDEAVRTLEQVQAQADDTAQAARIKTLRDDMVAAKTAAMRKQDAARVGRLFSNAMTVFQRGDYEHAMLLFQQVVDDEAKLQQPDETQLQQPDKANQQQPSEAAK